MSRCRSVTHLLNSDTAWGAWAAVWVLVVGSPAGRGSWLHRELPAQSSDGGSPRRRSKLKLELAYP